MKINAIFIENKANLGKPQFAGFVETFDDVPEICAYALLNFFFQISRTPLRSRCDVRGA